MFGVLFVDLILGYIYSLNGLLVLRIESTPKMAYISHREEGKLTYEFRS